MYPAHLSCFQGNSKSFGKHLSPMGISMLVSISRKTYTSTYIICGPDDYYDKLKYMTLSLRLKFITINEQIMKFAQN